ncbi:hypothetical protein A2714_01995 [Candidatus Woesebacteria bacterium RIFCSPHIGHO2_01_FULL_38_9]|uniref:Uncharacterized protein n=2 Tax=Candidatus Woeseibacteriota TaxID=1752722 RepID=A0A1F7Y1B4_9BACT|nr:MAG: hypothetical protein A2714_01995 [Candidatus Woesebacteria bacterium RIFCSPHIGHO2_01_FULL_38_9]OGM60170.1 MAG: hypothetical protein A3A75_05720 [Candidatus Woesebacteria bacterium RIFCSPLOWO2_01_FULL_39_10]
MNKDLAQKAISSALSGNWQEAIEANLQILKDNPNDIDALNRLARSYAESGNFKKAKATAQEVLKIDPFNSIATKSIEKWKRLKKQDVHPSYISMPQTFLEEPGKTKIVSLLYLGSPKAIAELDSGDEVLLNTHSHRVSVNIQDGKYIGRLPDDLSARLRKLIQLGNEYKVFVKSCQTQDVKVFIQEVKRAKNLSDVPSFSPEKIDYITFTPPELVHKKEDVVADMEEE